MTKTFQILSSQMLISNLNNDNSIPQIFIFVQYNLQNYTFNYSIYFTFAPYTLCRICKVKFSIYGSLPTISQHKILFSYLKTNPGLIKNRPKFFIKKPL